MQPYSAGKVFLILKILKALVLIRAVVVPYYGQPVPHQEFRGSIYRLNAETRQQELVAKNLSKAMSCLGGFLEQHLPVGNIPLVIVGNEEMTERTQYLVNRLRRSDLPVFLLSGELNPDGIYNSSLTALIVVDNSRSLTADNTSDFTFICSRKCVAYFLIIVQKYENLEAMRADAAYLVELMWERRIANLVLVLRIGVKFYLMRSPRFRNNETCAPEEPEILGECCLDTSVKKCRNLVERLYLPIVPNNCIFNVSYFEEVPYAMTLDNGTTSAGIESRIIATLAKSLHFQIDETYIPWGDEPGWELEIDRRLARGGGADIVYGGLEWAPTAVTDYTESYEATQIVWVVPYVTRISLSGLYNSFDDEVWASFLIILVASTLLGLIFRIKSARLLEMSGLVLGVGLPWQPHRASERIFFITWAGMSYILSQFYQGSLSSQLFSSTQVQIDNMSDLVTDFQLFSISRLYSVYKDANEMDFNNDKIPIYKMIKDKLEYMESPAFHAKILEVVSGFDESCAFLLQLNISSIQSKFSSEVFFMDEIAGLMPLSFATWRGFPMLARLDDTIYNIIEAGFIEFWAKDYVDTSYEQSAEFETISSNLKLDHLIPGFALLSIGFAAALLVLSLEIATFRYKAYKMRKPVAMYGTYSKNVSKSQARPKKKLKKRL